MSLDFLRRQRFLICLDGFLAKILIRGCYGNVHIGSRSKFGHCCTNPRGPADNQKIVTAGGRSDVNSDVEKASCNANSGKETLDMKQNNQCLTFSLMRDTDIGSHL